MQLCVIRGPVDGGPFDLQEGENIAGRSADCEVCLPSKRVSRHHCIFTLTDGRVIVRDLGSHNGILDGASGRRVSTLVLSPGGRVHVGDYLLGLEAETTDAVLEDDDDDVFIATSEIEAQEDDPDSDPDEELSLDDTAHSLRSAGLQPTIRPSIARERTQPTPPPQNGPWERTGARRGGPVIALAPRAETSHRARPRVANDESPTPRPGSLPVDDPTPRANPLIPGDGRPPNQAHVWLRDRGGPVPEEQPTAPPTPRPRPPEIRPLPELRLAAPRPAEPRTAEPRSAEPRTTEPRVPEPRPVAEVRPAAERPSRPNITDISRTAERARTGGRAGEPGSVPDRMPRTVPRPITMHPQQSESPSRGVPWVLQAAFLLMLCMGVLVFTPFGGLLGQLHTTVSLADKAALREGEAIAVALAARNAEALSGTQGTQLDLSLVAGATGVRDARVTDARGMVLAPPDRARFDMSHNIAFAQAMGSGSITSATTTTRTTEFVVPVHATASGPVVGYAWIEYDPSPVSATLVNPWIGAFASLVVAGFVGGFLVLGMWWLAMRPAQNLALSAERLASGRIDRVRPPARLDTWERLARALNELGARARQRGEE